MHLINAKRFIKIQVIKLTYEHALSSRQIATYLNRVNPYKRDCIRVKSMI